MTRIVSGGALNSTRSHRSDTDKINEKIVIMWCWLTFCGHPVDFHFRQCLFTTELRASRRTKISLTIYALCGGHTINFSVKRLTNWTAIGSLVRMQLSGC